MYCNDFRKCEDGVWRISKMRIGYRKMNGALDDYDVPKDWEPKKDVYKRQAMVILGGKIIARGILAVPFSMGGFARCV